MPALAYDPAAGRGTATVGCNPATERAEGARASRSGTLRIYESPGGHELDMPDKLTVSSRGGLVLCEDGTANPCVPGLTREGRITRFARNDVVLAGERNVLAGDYRTSECAGASPGRGSAGRSRKRLFGESCG